MKKRELIVGAMALAGTVSGMVSMQAAYAATLSCTDGTVSTPMTCSGDAVGDTYLAQPLNFTGSNGVVTKVIDNVSGVALCGWNINGRNSYGITTAGGSMVSRAGTGKAVNAASGCAN